MRDGATQSRCASGAPGGAVTATATGTPGRVTGRSLSGVREEHYAGYVALGGPIASALRAHLRPGSG
jgi:hypothetical protein